MSTVAPGPPPAHPHLPLLNRNHSFTTQLYRVYTNIRQNGKIIFYYFSYLIYICWMFLTLLCVFPTRNQYRRCVGLRVTQRCLRVLTRAV